MIAAEPLRPAAALPGDYHVHTSWSDGAGSVEECVARAVEVGLPEIAIADHITSAPAPDEHWYVAPDRLAEYCDEVRSVAARHHDIRVLLGLEAEYVEGREPELDDLLARWPFEIVVLGVHVVDGFAFDEPGLRDDARWDDSDALLARYYHAVRRAAEFGRFDVFAHLDYISLWGHLPGPAALRELDLALDALAASGGALELNTDRVSDPAGVMYPSPAILRAAHARGIPLVIDSDAHEAEHVGRLWDEAIALAGEAGYRETLRLSDHALVPLPGLG
jgi:histidinol-phosphatase (PHP family)